LTRAAAPGEIRRSMKTLSPAVLVVLLAIIASPSGAKDQIDAASRKDLAAMQGEWTMASGVADGYAIPDTMLKDFRRVCKGDEVTTTLGDRVVLKATVKLDPSKSPRTIDFAATDGPTRGKTHLGIYELDGDTFRSCFAAPGGDRPTDFTSKPGDGRTATVWKRAAPSRKTPEKRTNLR
jgi:uncharacterized protein (TIGR03067 family)